VPAPDGHHIVLWGGTLSTAYEFNRISALAANTFDNNARGIPRSVFTRNQFGYSLGGPIKRRRLYFFASTEWTRVRSVFTARDIVPTPEFIAAAASDTQAYMQQFGRLRPVVEGPVFTKAAVIASGIMPNPGGPFDQLPLTTPVFQQILHPLPLDAGGGVPKNAVSMVARVDYNLSDKTTVYARYALERSDQFQGTEAASAYQGYDMGQQTSNNNALLSITHVFSPSLVSQSKIVLNRLSTLVPLGANPPSPILNWGVTVFGNNVSLQGYQMEPIGGPQNLISG
jgi:hypothetical protein